MEIFAEIDRDTKLIRASNGEIANILGYDSTFDSDFKNELLRVGRKIDVRKFLRISKQLRALNTEYLTKISDKCDATSKLIAEATDLVKELECFDTLQGETK